MVSIPFESLPPTDLVDALPLAAKPADKGAFERHLEAAPARPDEPAEQNTDSAIAAEDSTPEEQPVSETHDKPTEEAEAQEPPQDNTADEVDSADEPDASEVDVSAGQSESVTQLPVSDSPTAGSENPTPTSAAENQVSQTAPEATAPEATAPEATAPEATAPIAADTKSATESAAGSPQDAAPQADWEQNQSVPSESAQDDVAHESDSRPQGKTSGRRGSGPQPNPLVNSPVEATNQAQLTVPKADAAALNQITSAGNAATAASDSSGPDQATPPPLVSGDSPSESNQRQMSERLLASARNSTDDASSVRRSDQIRMVQRVARAFQLRGDRDGPIRLRLSPPELGSLRLEVRLQQGNLTARIETDTQAARNLLLENLPMLRDRLAEQGIRVEQFDVDIDDGRPGGPQSDQQQESRNKAPDRAQGTADEPVGGGDAESQSGNRIDDHDGHINVMA